MTPPNRPGSRPYGHAPRPAWNPNRDDRAEQERIHTPPAPLYSASYVAAKEEPYTPQLRSVPPPELPSAGTTKSHDVLAWALNSIVEGQAESKAQGIELVKLRTEFEAYKKEASTAIEASKAGVAHTMEIRERDSKIAELQTQVTVTTTSRDHVVAETNEERKWRVRFIVASVVAAVGFVFTTLVAIILWLAGKK